MRVAVVGLGISGMVAGRLLAEAGHEVVAFEAGGYVGGHTATVDVRVGGRDYAIDTGFIVFNEKTYPRFCRLLEACGVGSQPSDMSFAVRCDRTGLEYASHSWRGLLARPSNAVRPGFWRMLRDIVRFNREAPALLAGDGDGAADERTLGAYLRDAGYSDAFVEQHIVPLGAAVWSARPEAMRELPVRSFVRFFANHGFLQVQGRVPWRVVRGGSRAYVEPLVAPFRAGIRTRTPIARIERDRAGVVVVPRDAPPERFDRVVLACHSDQALRILAAPTRAEREVLGAISYQPNDVVLHTDTSVLPRRRRAWASWNYTTPTAPRDRVAVHYLMNRLQTIPGPPWFVVSLNSDDRIDPARVLRRFTYDHPVFTSAAVAAQRRYAEVSGVIRTHYAGAYWGYGFHEDGVRSAYAAVRELVSGSVAREAPVAPLAGVA